MFSKLFSYAARFVSFIIVFIFFVEVSKANDSDVVNCNRAWKIVVMGSSTSFGTGASVYDSSWVGRFSNYIKRKNPNSDIINMAIPGITTYQNLRPNNYLPPVDRPLPIQGNNITAALALQPDAIIINMPSNDANNLYSLEEQKANFEAAIYLADSAQVPVWVTTSQPRNNMSLEQIGLLSSLRDWVINRFGAKAVDFWSDVANPDGSIVDFYDYDFVHVNNNGHALFFNRMRAETILDTLCIRYDGTLTVNAGSDTVLTLPTSSYAVPLTAISTSGIIQTYSWRKIVGPSSFVFQNENTASPEIANLIEGRYSFEVTVTDDRDNMKKDTISIIVQSRILIDFGQTPTTAPDANGNYWNNVLNATEGIKIANAITVGNSNSGLSLEVVNRIDGTFNLAGPGVNTGNTTGDISDYTATATTDYAFAHPSTDTGLWRISGLDSLKEYRVKFWGSRTVSDPRVIEIKMADESIWQSFDARNNVNYDQAAIFTISGKTVVDFNIRVAIGSSFGHIGIVDILRTSSSASVNILPRANAGNDLTIVIPESMVSLDGTSSIDEDGDIVTYTWRKIAGPRNYSIGNSTAAQTIVNNLTEGSYQFELKVVDNMGGIGKDTVNVIVGSRILIDFGPTVTSSPDASGKYWNQVANASNGIKLLDAVNTLNVNTNIGFEVVNRIDGLFNPAGPGVNTGNTTGDVGDYPATATTDYAFAEPSATNGQWKVFGLDSNKTYTVKFWGTRSVADPRFIEIKLTDGSNWQSYNAANNADFNQAVVFSFTGKSEAQFDIRVPSGSSFGYVSVIDIFKYSNPSNINLPPQAVAGNDVNLNLPSNSLTLNGSNSSDPDGSINAYQWTKISGPDQYEIVSPDNAITLINNLTEGTYQFELFVSDDNGLTDRDTVTVRVNSRILFDFGATLTPLPDVNGNYWNNITTANVGVKVVDAISVSNEPTGISMEVINRIDGTFNLAGPGVNTGNTIGDVDDYLNSATTDYAFAHPTATNGKWKFAGLDSTKQYSIKFWGTRSVADSRVIEIKTEEDINWKSFNATNNSNYDEAAVFDVIRKKEVSFDIRVQAGSSFGHISVVDITTTTPNVNCLPDTTRETASACNTYDWNGNTYTASGAYTFSTTNSNGCDSTAVLELTINAASNSSTIAAACGTYDWSGNTYTASGTYTFSTTNANGCDSTAVLELTINAASNSNTVAAACGTYDWNGNTYTASGTYTFSTTNANGCDSTAILELTINAASISNTVAAACGTYDWNGNTFTASGTYTFSTTNANGCDSTAILELTINAASNSSSVVAACGTYDWNGNTYTASGTYTFSTTNANGCDSTAILELTINAASNSSTVAAACGTYDWNGNTYTASGTYTFSTTNAIGCDSTAILELTINAASNSSTVAAACGTYDWNGNTYTASGTYTFSTINANGCDSTAILELTIYSVPFNVGSLTGPVNTCNYAGPLGQDATYIINTTNAALIEWQYPEEAVLVSQTANSITLHYSIAFSVGNIYAIVSSPCGPTQIRTLVLNGRAPASPGAIRGLRNVCNVVGTQQIINYSVTTVANVIYYKWSLPASVTLISANQDSSSINVIISSNFISLVNKTLKVQSVSGCGKSGFTSLTLSSSVPTIPGIISGPVNGCLYTTTNSPAQYKINKLSNATAYNWQVPAGVTILSHPAGLGENDTIIEVQFASSYVTSSTITVSAQASCGVSAVRSFTLSKIVPSAPYSITGPTNVCGYLGNDSAVAYTVRKVANANEYNWIVPSGVAISHPAGLGANDTIVVLRFPGTFSAGNLSVSAANGCGISNTSSLSLANVIVATPVLSGPTDACQYVDSAGTYTIRKVNGAISYNWVIPSIGVSSVFHPNGLGVNDTIIEVMYLSSFVRGNISVSASSVCNTSANRTLSVGRRLPSVPGPISGTVIVSECPKRRYIYSINELPSNATAVVWTVPVGAIIDSGQGGLRVYVSYSPGAIVSQNITVAGLNGCGAGAVRNLLVNLPVCVASPFAGNTQSSSLKSISANIGEVFPNPSSTFFKLNLPTTDHSPFLLRVRNVVGKVIMEKKISIAAPVILHSEHWSNGIYFCEWSQGNRSGVLKLIKL